MMTAAPIDDVEVGFVTDVEGNLGYFDRWVTHSGVLRYIPGTDELELTHERAYFVFGGDIMDRFDGSLRLARRIVSLKKRHPNRVFLLAGNRDLNKVRLTSELADEDMLRPFDTIPGPHWDPKAPTLCQYLDGLALERGTTASLLDSKAERLRYYLIHTLGCPEGFELRRQELGLLRQTAAISDDDVVESMLADIRPPAAGEPVGVLRDYLEHASIAVCLGNTMFVHGALDRSVIGVVPEDGTRFCTPSTPQPFRTVRGGVAEWAREMNELMQRGLSDHAARPSWDANRSSRGGEALMALQNRASLSGRCVVSSACTVCGASNARRDPSSSPWHLLFLLFAHQYRSCARHPPPSRRRWRLHHLARRPPAARSPLRSPSCLADARRAAVRGLAG